MTPEGMRRAAEWIRDAHRVVVSTGAGMSRESGIPTFRDAQEGLWASFDPQDLATEAGFRAAPARVWGWYASRRRSIAACAPHHGYHALVEMERRLGTLPIVTQNIDGLHRLAGSSDVIELHGNIHRYRCLDAGHPASHPVPVEEGDQVDPPACVDCASPLRPDVVWFGEMLPRDATERAWDLAARCDLLLVIGTSGMVWPAAELPHVARGGGARIVEINPLPSEITPHVDLFLGGPAGEVLPALVDALTH